MVACRDPTCRCSARSLTDGVEGGQNRKQFAAFCIGKHQSSPYGSGDDQRAPSWTKGDMVVLPLAGEIGAAILDWPSMRNVVRNAVRSASKYRCMEVAVCMPPALVMVW